MAAPTVRGFAAATNTTDALPAVSITLPTRAAGDLLIAFAAGDSATAFTHTQTTNWSEISDEVTSSTRLAVYARIATNDATDALSIAGANTQDASFNMVAITAGTHGVVNPATDIVMATAAAGATGNANPPSLNAFLAKDWLAIAIAAVDLTATGSSITAAPTNYTTGAILQKSASSTSSVALGVGYRALSASTTEDPGTFTNTSGVWLAKTIFVRPAEADDGTASVYFDAVADRYTRSATGLGGVGVTMSCWVKFHAHTSSWRYFIGADNGSSYFILGLTDSNQFHASTSGGSIDNVFTPTLDVWYFVAIVYDPSGTDHVYYCVEGASTLTDAPGTIGGITDSWTFQIGANSWGEWAHCSVSDTKVWAASLTKTELEGEIGYYVPQRTANLWASYYFDDGISTIDQSGNGRTLTANGTITSNADGPAIAFDSSGPMEGAATGSIAWVGSSTGTRTPKGEASGSIAWVGSSTGKKLLTGSASGAISWAGSSTGVRVSRGESTGAISWSGVTTGARAANGASTGSIAWVGSSTGARASSGAASGAIAWVGVAVGGNLGVVIGSITWAGTADGVSPSISINEGDATGSISWVGSSTGVRTPKGEPTGSISWVGSSTGVKLTTGSASGAISWVGSSTGTRTPKGASTGSIAWVGSSTGARASTGSTTGSISWAGSSTGTRASSGSTTGSISWAGSITGARASSGSTTGSVNWVGVAIGGNLGVVIGSITWTGTATGTKLSSGNASGAIDWVGSVIGFAPTVGINDGQGLGSISWVGSATGVRISNGSASGSISWIGTADGDAPAVGINDGEATGSVVWSGTSSGVKAPFGTVIGAISWAGVALGAELGIAIGTITWVGTAEGFAETLPTQDGNAVGTITWAGTAIGSSQHTGEVFGLIVYMGVALSLVTADPAKFLFLPHARGYSTRAARGHSNFTEVVTGYKPSIVTGRSKE